MPNLMPFAFEGKSVRVIERDGEPWFVAADVCAVLDISKHRDALSRLDDDERGSVLVDTLGGAQEMGAINESGLYSLIMTSRKATAKRFKKWVTAEVLPSIRKTGSYRSSTGDALLDSIEAVRDLRIAQLETEKRQAIVERRLDVLEAENRLNPDFLTIVGWMNLHGKKIDNRTANQIGRVLSSYCKSNGYTVAKTHHQMFGAVNTYPVEAMEAFFSEKVN